jgi:tetratricopeptide (TPR) repeat protein
MSGNVTSAEGRSILAHLLTDCRVCREITGPLSPFGTAVPLEEGDQQFDSTDHAEGSFASHLVERLREREKAIDYERREAPNRVAELEAQEHPHRLLLVRNSGRFLTWGIAELLVDESYRHRFNDADRALQLAELGVEAADRLDPATYGDAAMHDLRARAWAMRGNALRIRSDLTEAGRCLTRALKLLEDGTGDPLEEARVCELLSALRSNQGRIEQAVRLQERAMRLYRRAGHRDRLGKAMVDLASYTALAGDRDHAIELIHKALDLVDGERDPHTVLAARHNLALFLQESGRVREALGVLAKAKPLYERLGDRYNLLRLRWLEGKLGREVGDFRLAEEAFDEVYRGFVDVTPIAAARAALDLALVYFEVGRVAEVPAIILAVEKVFRAQSIEPDALAAWLVLREAVDRRRLHQALLKDIAARLQSVRDRPTR